MSPFLANVRVLGNADASSSDVTIQSNPTSVIVHKPKSDSSDGAFAIPIVAIVFTFLYLIVKALMAPFTNRAKHGMPLTGAAGLTDEELAVMDKLQRTLGQMESRVEALETIIIETSRKERSASKL